MVSNNDFARIAALNLNPIKVKLMHKESGEGWSLEHANAIETEYRRFLYLMLAFPHVETAPLVDVDTFWHYHILDTMKYARDCEQAFGYFVHHYPYLGLEGDNGVEMHQQAGERMRELYESTFGVSYVRQASTAGAPEANDVQTAYASAMSEAANSVQRFGPGNVKAGDVQTAYCLGPGIAKAAAVETAYCLGPGIVKDAGKAAAVRTAYCLGPGIAKEAAVETAYCLGPGIVKEAGKAAAVRTSYCLGPG